MRICLVQISILLFVMGCHNQQNKPDISNSVTTKNIATRFVDAYNQHDVSGMLQWVHEDIRYMYVLDDVVHTETSGKHALQQFLLPYFVSKPQAYSALLSSSQQGPFIQQIEKAIWHTESGVIKSQCSLSIYQLKDELIINVWYFDVFQCPIK